MRNLIRTMIILLGAGWFVAGASNALAGTPLKVWCVGDSITDDTGAPGSYRTKLYTELVNRGYSPSFLGSRGTAADRALHPSSPTLTTAGQTMHDGRSGFRLDTINNNLDANDISQSSATAGGYWLTGGPVRPAIAPDVTLVLGGGNDMYTSATNTDIQNRMTTLVNRLYSLNTNPNARVFVAQTSPIRGTNGRVVALNDWLGSPTGFLSVTGNPALSPTARARTIVVNQYANFTDASGNPVDWTMPGSHMADNAHPNQVGFDLMGTTWANAITSVPEPTSFLTFIGIGAAGLMRRRKRV